MANPNLDYYQGALTGNLITILVAGKPIGLIRSMQVQEDFGLQPVSGIGMLTPAEHVVSQSRINISCEAVYISIGSAAKDAGGKLVGSPSLKPDRLATVARFNDLDATNTSGGGSSRIIPGRMNDALKGTVFTIRVEKLDGKNVRTYEGCSYGGGSISFQAHQIIVQNATFMAIDYYDEFTTASSQS